MYRCYIEQQDEPNKDEDWRYQAYPQKNQLSSSIIYAKSYEWHDGVRYEEAKYEAKQMGIIVYPWK